jgi:hypothetical protein
MKVPKQKHPKTPPSVPLDALLSPQWAFVVQFRAVPGGAAHPAGRVEHLVSGRMMRFQSLSELAAYLEEELRSSRGEDK